MADFSKNNMKNNSGIIGNLDFSKKKNFSSIFYKVCQLFLKEAGKVEIESEYLLEADRWTKKLNYNEINEHKKVFDDILCYNQFTETVMGKIDYSDKLVMFINRKYTRMCIKNLGERKDVILSFLYEDLEKDLKECLEADKDADILDLEDIDIYIYSLIFYCFTRCKVLNPIPKEEEK